MTLVEFFSMDMEPQNRTQFVYRADELPSLPSGAVSMRLVGQAHPSRDITFLDETYPPGTGTGIGDEMYHHTGQETGMVIEGRLELTVEGEVVVLAPGDSYYFDSNRPHRFRNPFNEPARLISATTPANF
jgi:mannose-6-phosphate isomerase-like protein (cupin superfamily)